MGGHCCVCLFSVSSSFLHIVLTCPVVGTQMQFEPFRVDGIQSQLSPFEASEYKSWLLASNCGLIMQYQQWHRCKPLGKSIDEVENPARRLQASVFGTLFESHIPRDWNAK